MKAGKWRYAVVIAAVALAGCGRHKERRRRCVSSLKSLGYAIDLYAEDNDGDLPSDLGELFPHYMEDAMVLLCPDAGHALEFAKADLPANAKDASGVLGPEHTDYGYVSGFNREPKAWWVLLFDKTPHPGGVRNVAYVGGNIMAISEVQFKRELERTLREVRAAGFDARICGYGPGEELPVTLDE